jgi:Malectin-like domain
MDSTFGVPPVVLETAATTSSIEEPLSFDWSTDPSTKYYFIFYIYEIQKPLSGRREFDVCINDIFSFNEPFIPSIYDYTYIWATYWNSGFGNYNVTLVATSNSTLPPLLNAFELYTVVPVDISTEPNDGMLFNHLKFFVDYLIPGNLNFQDA